MLSHTCSLFSRMCVASGRRTVITAAAKEIQDTKVSSFRTMDSYPPEHDINNLNRIYTVPETITNLLMPGVPHEMKKQIKIFHEFSILIRKPAIELISYLEQTDYTKCINKYVLYGKLGAGKTITLLHLIHYGLTRNFVIVYLPWVANWFRFPKVVVQSVSNPDKLDLPEEVANWLKFFKCLNEMTLSQLDLKVSKEYTWSQRESTNCGDSLFSLIDFGIQRTKFACGVVHALLDEIKTASIAGKCRTLVVIDGFNAFTAERTVVRDENHVYVTPDRMSITSAFFDIVNYNWCNGAVILTVDTRADNERKKSIYPVCLLGKKGFEHLDPFLPICVENYSTEEFQTILKYYEDRKWIRDISPQAQKEWEMLCNKNPREIWNFSKPL
ncbi:28S ribosomal protein S29, mitochondrial [Anthophora quadrimaculata]